MRRRGLEFGSVMGMVTLRSRLRFPFERRSRFTYGDFDGSFDGEIHFDNLRVPPPGGAGHQANAVKRLPHPSVAGINCAQQMVTAAVKVGWFGDHRDV